jgi:hypothetical protein
MSTDTETDTAEHEPGENPVAETTAVAVADEPTTAVPWLSAVPLAWRAPLGRSLARGGLSSLAVAGLEAIRRAAHQADCAADFLADAAAYETDPETAAILTNLRLAALHLLVTADHVARGGDLRGVAGAVSERGESVLRYGSQSPALRRGAEAPFHVWAVAGGLSGRKPMRQPEEA